MHRRLMNKVEVIQIPRSPLVLTAGLPFTPNILLGFPNSMRVRRHLEKNKQQSQCEECQCEQIFMMLSGSSGNQKGMRTEDPAALRRMAAVHHNTLCYLFHQLNTKRLFRKKIYCCVSRMEQEISPVLAFFVPIINCYYTNNKRC